MNNIIATMDGSILTLKIDVSTVIKPGKTNGVRINAMNQDFITVGHYQGDEIGLGNLFVTRRPDPKLPRPEIKKAQTPEQHKKVQTQAKKPEVKLTAQPESKATLTSNPFNLSL
jgi:hypothetical protein